MLNCHLLLSCYSICLVLCTLAPLFKTLYGRKALYGMELIWHKIVHTSYVHIPIHLEKLARKYKLLNVMEYELLNVIISQLLYLITLSVYLPASSNTASRLV